jgi:hypothetical protein
MTNSIGTISNAVAANLAVYVVDNDRYNVNKILVLLELAE